MQNIIAQKPKESKFKEWVFYDGQCLMCINLAHRAVKLLNARGIGLTPVQAKWVKHKIFHIHDPLKEMLVQTSNGNIIGGADAVIYLSRQIWWAYGLFIIAQIPGMKIVLRRIYGMIAKNRYCISGSCRVPIKE